MPEGRGFIGRSAATLPLPSWLTEAELAFFTEQYKESGFRGGLNWYRNIDRNWELTAPWQGAQIRQPAAFIAGSNDPVISDKMSGKQVGAVKIPSKTTAVPMTFLHKGKQYIVFATGLGSSTALVALTLPK